MTTLACGWPWITHDLRQCTLHTLVYPKSSASRLSRPENSTNEPDRFKTWSENAEYYTSTHGIVMKWMEIMQFKYSWTSLPANTIINMTFEIFIKWMYKNVCVEVTRHRAKWKLILSSTVLAMFSIEKMSFSQCLHLNIH